MLSKYICGIGYLLSELRNSSYSMEAMVFCKGVFHKRVKAWQKQTALCELWMVSCGQV